MEAKILGIDVPTTLLVQADGVIEGRRSCQNSASVIRRTLPDMLTASYHVVAQPACRLFGDPLQGRCCGMGLECRDHGCATTRDRTGLDFQLKAF